MNNNEQNSSELSKPSRQIGNDDTPAVNHAYWMTEIADKIGHLKIHQLALPSAHNAAADYHNMTPITRQWAVCQHIPFEHQLTTGIRVLDFRINAELSHQGTITFFHGIVTILQDLASAVRTIKTFAENNPGEILILEIGHLKPGLLPNWENSVILALRPLDNLLLPRNSVQLTLNQMRQHHPGKNIIITAKQELYSRNKLFWSLPKKVWSGEDSSIARLTEFTNTLNSTLDDNGSIYGKRWSMQSVARDINGAKQMTHEHAYWYYFYKTGRGGGLGQKCNIINADYTNDNLLIEYCIKENIERAKYPTEPPYIFAPEYIYHGEPSEGKFEIKLRWFYSGSREYYYIIYKNGTSTYNTPIEQFTLRSDDVGFDVGVHRFEVSHISIQDVETRKSSELLVEIPDRYDPTIPTNLKLSNIGFTEATLTWAPSKGASTISHYEIYKNGVKQDPAYETTHTFKDLDKHAHYIIQVRAKDVLDRMSPAASIELGGRPKDPVIKFSAAIVSGTKNWLGVFAWNNYIHLDRNHYYETRLNGEPHDNVPADRDSIASKPITIPSHVDYTFEARAVLQSGETSEWGSLTVSKPVYLVAPKDLSASNLTETSVKLTWYQRSVGMPFTHYAINYNGVFVVMENPPRADKNYTFDDLKPGTRYVFEICAIDEEGDSSAPANIEVITPGISKPGKPGTPVVSNITGTSASLNWEAPAETISVTGYNVSLNGGTAVWVAGLSHTFDNLSDASTYSVEIRTTNANGDESEPASEIFTTLDVTAPSKPGSLPVTDVSETAATLAWTVSSDNVAVTGYQVWLESSHLDTVTDTRYLATGLKADTSYTFRIIARDSAGNLSEPAVVSFRTKADTSPPDKPTGLDSVNVSSRAAALVWNRAYDNLRVDHYEVSRGETVVGITSTNAPYYLAIGLVAGTRYSFSVRALDEAGNRSLTSEPIIVRTPTLSPPKNVSIQKITPNSIEFTWQRPDDAIGFIGYRTIVKRPSGGTIIYELPKAQLTVETLLPATRYQVSVSAYDASQFYSDPLTFEIATTGALPRPSAPKNLHLVRDENGAVYAEWESPDVSNDLLGYRVEIISPSNSETITTPETHALMPADPDTAYEVTIVAYSAQGDSQPRVGHILARPAPTAPMDLVVVNAGTTFLKLAWTPPRQSASMTGYVIIAQKAEGNPLTYKTTGPNTTLGLLRPSTTYALQITAQYSDGTLGVPLIGEATTT